MSDLSREQIEKSAQDGDASGAPDRRSMHCGTAPTSGEKWVLSQGILGQIASV